MKKTIIAIELVLALIATGILIGHGINRNRNEASWAVTEKLRDVLVESVPEAPHISDITVPADADEWNLLLVNPWNLMPDNYVEEQVYIGYTEGYPVDKRVQEPLEEMLAACRDAGHRVQIISAYRDHATQQALYNRTANKADTAYPGTSEHECGLAIDIIDSDSAHLADPLIDEQETYEGQKWLMNNCQDYGFILRYPKDKEEITGIIYEPWHYRYVGKEHASRIMEQGICLEEYLGRVENEKTKIRDQ